MSIEIVTTADLERFRAALLRDLLQELNRQPQPEEWLKTAAVRRLLGCSQGTLQHLRESGKLPYSKLGGMIFYRRSDIEKLLLSHRQDGV